jgi:hypothetical protein
MTGKRSPCKRREAVSLAKVGRLPDAKAEAERVVALDPTFTMQRWSVTVGQLAAVFGPIADAWRGLGMPMK